MTKTVFINNFFRIYNLIWTLALPFLKTNPRLWEGFEKRVSFSHLSPADLWIQAASAGEAYLAVALVSELRPGMPLRVLVTTTTAQGMDILKSGLAPENMSENIALQIDWFPFDMPDLAEAAVSAVSPRVMVLLETELWPGLLFYLKRKSTKILMINARMSKKSCDRYRVTRFLWKHLAPDLILAVSGHDKKRFQMVFKTSSIRTMQNIKFDSMDNDPPAASNGLNPLSRVLSGPLPLTILASIRRQEEKQVFLIVKTLFQKFPNQIVAIFPRHMNRIKSWEALLSSLDVTFHKRSGLSHGLTGPCIILWDMFGELKSAYAHASAVFVGGSLKPLGGQNVIEPAREGAVTVTGPYYADFAWAAEDMIKAGLIIREKNWNAVAKTLVSALEHPEVKTAQTLRVRQFLNSKKGGTKTSCLEILKSFDLLD